MLSDPTPCVFRYQYVEVDIDIHRFSYLARSGVHTLLPRIPEADVGIALVLEGRSEEELPEQVLGAVKLSKLQFDTAERLDIPP